MFYYSLSSDRMRGESVHFPVIPLDLSLDTPYIYVAGISRRLINIKLNVRVSRKLHHLSEECQTVYKRERFLHSAH